MDSKTMLKVFGGAFLRSMIVLMAIAILGFGIFFIVKVGSDKKNEVAEDTGVEDTEYSPEELEAMMAEDNAINSDMPDEEVTSEEITEEMTTEEVVTEEVTTEAVNIPSTDKNIIVLNSTATTGLAGSWASKLNSAGFAQVAVGNYSGGAQANTTIYVSQEGMGNDLLDFFNGASVSMGSVDANTFSVKSGAMDRYDIYIVIGNSDTTVR